MEKSPLLARCREFAGKHGLILGDELGAGIQGIVIEAKKQVRNGRWAIKAHRQEAGYCRERDAYLRLTALRLTEIQGCNVPELIAFYDALWIIVMTIVTRPFVLDFGGAYLDTPPEFSDEVWAEWQTQKAELFGTRWPQVQAILREFQGHGLYLIDPNPGNVAFDD
jgi:hypothetical protein